MKKQENKTQQFIISWHSKQISLQCLLPNRKARNENMLTKLLVSQFIRPSQTFLYMPIKSNQKYSLRALQQNNVKFSQIMSWWDATDWLNIYIFFEVMSKRISVHIPRMVLLPWMTEFLHSPLQLSLPWFCTYAFPKMLLYSFVIFYIHKVYSKVSF